jgi:hypothetical protein
MAEERHDPPPPREPEAFRFSWIAAQRGRTEHAVTEDAHAEGMEAGDGMYLALCGVTFLAASMSAEPNGQCSQCCTFLRARFEMRDFPRRMSKPRRKRRIRRRASAAREEVSRDQP